MRVVLDTNILARARTGPRGPAGDALRIVLQDQLLIVSPSLLTELSRVLKYPRMRELHGADDAGIDEYIRDLQQAACVVAPAEPLNPPLVTNDPDDDAVIAAALAGAATVICTRDRHLLHTDVRAQCAGIGIKILTELELLAQIRGNRP